MAPLDTASNNASGSFQTSYWKMLSNLSNRVYPNPNFPVCCCTLCLLFL